MKKTFIARPQAHRRSSLSVFPLLSHHTALLRRAGVNVHGNQVEIAGKISYARGQGLGVLAGMDDAEGTGGCSVQ